MGLFVRVSVCCTKLSDLHQVRPKCSNSGLCLLCHHRYDATRLWINLIKRNSTCRPYRPNNHTHIFYITAVLYFSSNIFKSFIFSRSGGRSILGECVGVEATLTSVGGLDSPRDRRFSAMLHKTTARPVFRGRLQWVRSPPKPSW